MPADEHKDMSMDGGVITVRPSVMQFVVSEATAILITVVVFALVCLCQIPTRFIVLTIVVIGVLLFYLLYRCLYITRIVYVITDEQIQYRVGLLNTISGYIELYRVVDYGEHRSFLQILFGLKTVSIYSGNRTTPRLNVIGVPAKTSLIPILRSRVEANKRRRNIHEFTNTF